MALTLAGTAGVDSLVGIAPDALPEPMATVVPATYNIVALTILRVGQLVTVVMLVWYAVLLMLTRHIRGQTPPTAETPSPPEREGVSWTIGVRPERR